MTYRNRVIEIFQAVRKDLVVEMPTDGKTVRLTGTQIRANLEVEYVNPFPGAGAD